MNRGSIVYVRHLSEYKKGDTKLVGGKAESLARLWNANVPGSPGFAIEVEAYRAFLATDPELIPLIGQLDKTADKKTVGKLATQIRRRMKQAKIPTEVEAQITAAYQQHLADQPVAVRSSASNEDGVNASFAGQHLTVLGALGVQAVLKAVKDCWISLYTDHAINYRKTSGFTSVETFMGVVVQKLVQAVKAGVMFTANPVNKNRSQHVVASILGLGELYVSGAVKASTYFVEKQTAATTTITASQTRKMVWDVQQRKSVVIPVNEEESSALRPDELAALVEYADRVQTFYGMPMDIEWAVEQSNGHTSVMLLQARPITSLDEDDNPEPAPKEDFEPWAKGIGVSMGAAYGKVRLVKSASQCGKLKKGEVLVTTMTDPAFEPAMERSAAVITVEGGALSHAAVVCQELRIPAVTCVDRALELQDGEWVTVVSDGSIYKGKAPNALAWNERRKLRLQSKKDRVKTFKTRTKIGAIVSDPNLAVEAAQNADLVSLFRSEFFWMKKRIHPLEVVALGQTQKFISGLAESLIAFCEAFMPKYQEDPTTGIVLARTIDSKAYEMHGLRGGKKWEKITHCDFMNWRGVDRYLGEPEMFALECEAWLRVWNAGYDNLRMMFPFVRGPERLQKVIELAQSFGLPKDPKYYAMMLEVPENFWRIHEYAPMVGYFSIGTNDYTAMMVGRDRDADSRIQGLYTEMNPAVQYGISHAVSEAVRLGVPIGLCGQMVVNYPDSAKTLAELGINSLGVNLDLTAKAREVVWNAEQSFQQA